MLNSSQLQGSVTELGGGLEVQIKPPKSVERVAVRISAKRRAPPPPSAAAEERRMLHGVLMEAMETQQRKRSALERQLDSPALSLV